MSTVVITLDSSFLHRTIDLELPGEVALGNLLPELVRALQLPAVDNVRRPIVYQLVHRQRPLRETESLLEAGVVTGDTLSLVSVSQIGATSGGASVGHWGASALLRCPSGAVIVLDSYGKLELTIGRYDARTGKTPDIDLSGELESNTVSRSHALLRKVGVQWVLVPLAAKNVTRVGQTSLAPQQMQPLRPGDLITLGAVRLIFEAGHS